MKDIKTYRSLFFKDIKREIIIIEPDYFNEFTPILFFYEKHVLDQPAGINIFNEINQKFILVAINSIDYEHKDVWDRRSAELKMKINDKYAFNLIVNEIIRDIRKKYKGPLIGFGFSLSGMLILNNQDLFDQVVAISPYLNVVENINSSATIFYGEKEVENNWIEEYNQPICNFSQLNRNAKVFMLTKMKHTFESWSSNFHFIVKKLIIE